MKNHITKKEIKLLNALNEMYPDSSNKTLRDMLKNKMVSIDGKLIVNANTLVEKDSTVSIGFGIKKVFSKVEILFEDAHIVIINKPDRLLSVPLDSGNEINVLQILREHFKSKNVFAVHRIDKSTSGIMIFARTLESKHILDKMFKSHLFKRVYLAIVSGAMKKDKGTFKSYLVNHKEYEVQTTFNKKEGKEAITHYEVLRRSKNFSFLKVTLQTGRKHQIRVHLKEAGHPIAGDKRYGLKEIDPINRIALHAHVLEFSHPLTNKKMSFSSPIPQSFKKLGVI